MNPRIERLRESLEEPLLVTNPTNINYLFGFKSSNAALLVERERARLFTDFRYSEAARAVEGVEFEETKRALLKDLADRLSGPIGFEADFVSYSGYETLRGGRDRAGSPPWARRAAARSQGRQRARVDQASLRDHGPDVRAPDRGALRRQNRARRRLDDRAALPRRGRGRGCLRDDRRRRPELGPSARPRHRSADRPRRDDHRGHGLRRRRLRVRLHAHLHDRVRRGAGQAGLRGRARRPAGGLRRAAVRRQGLRCRCGCATSRRRDGLCRNVRARARPRARPRGPRGSAPVHGVDRHAGRRATWSRSSPGSTSRVGPASGSRTTSS